ncbi:hypothetical protein G3554_27240 [Micromonospora sp. PPF5-17]|uniref:Uncharacterized protein n=1 Tax=Micromonospora solifontis TaxID=2487138 RepID=A0ABX9W837_9ACTN|nr:MULTISPECIES: hypothetical protein [Micromonospora]NES39786.1 hypothetical protein [Micromonospora solifontis]NES58088.1 hypothetical protein [Micromonospora sp. PPF5-6]RNL85400.1 hypothetical protein EFE23_27390 [Micromonospora solifontis]
MPDELTTDLLPYAEVTDTAYAEQAASGFAARPHGPAVLLSGACPRCGHATTSVLVDELFRREPPPVDPDPGYRTVLCECAAEHPRRPAGMVGCGAYWTLHLEDGA